uniref:Uncharacterized protein n=2 Tax=Cacopsylla melanoneura TaxID=428564 RepID=A0A8D8RK94_9HEMI
MFLASLVQQSSSRTVPNKLPDKMKLLLGLSLIVLIIQGVFSVATHTVAPSKKTIKAEAPEPIQSEDEGEDIDFLQSATSRAILSKTMQTMLKLAMDEEVNNPIIETLSNVNHMFQQNNTESIMTKTLQNFNRMVLIPANLHLLDLLIDSSHFTLTGSVTRRAIEHIFTLIGYFAEDPVAKDIATKSARLAYQVTSDKHLFASARAVVDQLITLLHKDKLRAVQDLVLAVDKHLTGNTIPPIVLDNVGMLGMPGKGGAGVMPGRMGKV